MKDDIVVIPAAGYLTQSTSEEKPGDDKSGKISEKASRCMEAEILRLCCNAVAQNKTSGTRSSGVESACS